MSRMMWLMVVLVAMAAGPAFADNLVFGSPGNITWINPVSGEDVYISPYTASDTGPSETWTNQAIYCLDYTHQIDPPTDWSADILAVNGTNYSSFALQPAGGITAYYEAVWLFQQEQLAFADMSLHPGNLNQDTINAAEDQIAAWYLFDPAMFGTNPLGTSLVVINASHNSTTSINAPYNPTVSGIVTLGEEITLGNINSLITTALGNINPSEANSDWSVVDPTIIGVGEPQEFLVNKSGGTVPEPASILLLGIVLVGCGRGLARRWS